MNFNVLPALENELVLMRPLLPGDFDVLYEVASEPILWKHHPVSHGYIKSSFRKFFDEALQAGALLITDKRGNKVIGCTRFYDHNADQSSIVIGHTFISGAYWGKGYNKSVKQLMVGYAFQFVNTIIFYVIQENIRSRKALEKAGARAGHTLIRKYNGKELTCIIYTLERKNQ